jgi:hypothetical protein
VRKLHNKELHKLYYSQNIMVIRSRRMVWMVYVARMGEMRNACKISLRGRGLWMCTNVVQDRVQWQAIANTVMDL